MSLAECPIEHNNLGNADLGSIAAVAYRRGRASQGRVTGRPVITPPGPNSAQIRRAMDISRRTGAPLLGCLFNLTLAPSRLGGVGLRVDDGVSALTGVLDIAVVADFALGYAVRQVTQQLRSAVPTIDLALNLTADLPAGGAAGVSTSPATVHTSTSLGSATGEIQSSSGDLIGHCSAVFAGPRGQAVEPLPWELPSNDDAATLDSTPEERDNDDETARIIREAVTQADQQHKAWPDVLLGLVAPTLAPGRSTERVFLARTLVANRSGFIQGGVLFALGVESSRSDPAELVCGDMRFIRPARADLPLHIETRVEHHGRRTEFASSHLYQDDVLVATGTFAFRRR